ncbi:MAG: putative Phosphatase [Rickettsiaceae bacterium]|jgi:phosphoglycolate phosphatase|nr:putative Phosphatase [Rickettsiaceae bacterium]
MQDNKLPSAVIFDWDNTLVDSWTLIHHAINETMQKTGKEQWSLEKIKNDVHKSMRESFPQIFGDRWQEAGEIYRNSYRSQHLEKMQFLPGALELINFLFEKKITLFVISNKMGETLRMEVENLKVKDRFLAIIGSGDTNFDKPHKAPVEFALDGTDIDPQQELVWFIGDTITDVECALNSGCQPILYGEGINVPKDLIAKESAKKERPMLCFPNHQAILSYCCGLK